MRQLSMTSRAWRMDKNQCSFRHSSRNLPLKLSTKQFWVGLLGVSVRTLQDWEQGRREPSGAAKTLLKIAVAAPELVRLSA